MQAVESLKICILMGSFFSKAYNAVDEKVQKKCLMTLKSDPKVEEKLTLGSKNDMRNFVNFNASSENSKNFHFDVVLLSIAYKV